MNTEEITLGLAGMRLLFSSSGSRTVSVTRKTLTRIQARPGPDVTKAR